jgi:hypothetical protein
MENLQLHEHICDVMCLVFYVMRSCTLQGTMLQISCSLQGTVLQISCPLQGTVLQISLIIFPHLFNKDFIL